MYLTIVHLQISVKGLLNRKKVRRYFAQSHIRKLGYKKKYIYKQYFQKTVNARKQSQEAGRHELK